jgi:hypothetical protein
LAPRVTPERGRPARLTDVRQVLLSELDEIQPQTRTVVLLQDWVESRRWPARLDDDLDKVQKVLRAKRRELNDNTEADQICRRLLRKVRELSESG